MIIITVVGFVLNNDKEPNEHKKTMNKHIRRAFSLPILSPTYPKVNIPMIDPEYDINFNKPDVKLD